MFTKMLFLNFEESNLKPEFWKRIDRITQKRILLSAENHDVSRHLKDVDCLLLKLGMSADKTFIDHMPKLKYIGMYGTGFGRIDVEYARKKRVTVCNIAGYATEGVAEFVFGALLEYFREISRAKMQAKAGNYSEASFTGTEIKEKTFGVIGLGRIGARVADLASRGFGAHVLYWSKNNKKNTTVKRSELNTMLKNSDIISLHMALNPETNGFLNAKRIAMIKSGVVVINTAPMELINTSALEKRLKKKDLTIILDHSDELEPTIALRLSKYPNCILKCTPLPRQ